MTKRVTRNTMAALLAGAALAPGAWAQTLDEPGEGVTLDTMVVTASGGPVDLRDAPASITVITQEEIRNTAAQNVRDVLSKTEGITLGRGGNMNTVQIRGLSERYTLFLIDGKRVSSDPNLFRGNDYDSGWIPVDAIERIEVVRGPMSSLYGSDAMGGVINIITKKDADELTGSLTADYTLQENSKAGDSWLTSMYLAGPLADQVGFRLSGSWAHRDADDWEINEDPSLAGFTEATDKFLDGTLYWRPNAENEVEVNGGWSERDHDGFPLKRYEVGVTHYGYYGFGTTESRIWADRIENEYGHGNRLGEDQPNTAWNNGFDGKAVMPLTWGAPQSLTLGLSYLYQKIEDTYVLTGPGGSESSVWQGALYAEDEIRFTDDFLVTLGLRYDDNEYYGGHVSPRVYGVYHLIPDSDDQVGFLASGHQWKVVFAAMRGRSWRRVLHRSARTASR
ncbi:TonB-dependent receptor, partial [Amaricoccus sp.]|uniref:TonB-dependent receptor domain-containing protein n=1 Tax=Amaricoccus sp. TaxID=1872485 RepID=UPI001B455F3E